MATRSPRATDWRGKPVYNGLLPNELVMYCDPETNAAALYVRGVLDQEGEEYNVIERIFELLGMTYHQDDVFLLGSTMKHSAAERLAQIEEYGHERAQKKVQAEALRDEAEKLMAQANKIDPERVY